MNGIYKERRVSVGIFRGLWRLFDLISHTNDKQQTKPSQATTSHHAEDVGPLLHFSHSYTLSGVLRHLGQSLAGKTHLHATTLQWPTRSILQTTTTTHVQTTHEHGKPQNH